MRICIDPGHSGSFETGAVCGGMTEAKIVMNVSLFLETILLERGHVVILTRRGEIETDGLSFRAEVAYEFEADIFISIHCNAVVNHAAKGTEVFYWQGSPSGRKLAAEMQREIILTMGTWDRGVKTKNLAVLRETTCPAVLVELAFITNDDDRAILADPFLQKGFAVAMANAAEAYVA